MRKSYLFTATLLVWSSISLGQIRSEVDIQISATVEPTLEMVTLANIDVGTVIPADNRIKLDPRTGQGAGLIMLTGSEGTEIQITFTDYVEMTNVNSEIPLAVFYSVSGNSSNNQSGSTLFTTNPSTISLNNKGEFYVWIGCDFSLENIVSGQYDGDFLLEVDYSQ